MASNNVLGDEESQLSGGTNRVQPYSSTPKKNIDDEARSKLLSQCLKGLAFMTSFLWILGAIFGALALKAMVSSTIAQTFSLGGCIITVIAPGRNGPVTVGLEMAQALWLEIFCTFGFLFASTWMAYDHRQDKALGHVTVLFIVGLVLGHLVFISTTVTAKKGYAGAGMNPTSCFGAALVRGGHLWDGHWVFWVGPTIACLAFYMYTKIIPPKHFQANYGYKHDFLGVVKALSG
ncbi:hypothetical protein RND71_035612 [Anisodus tanguticus]|uniref:Uncharacterized protein n=1 Tax=Anisodus tanguticus TaxID=243964 RepID=A0AAE1R584_9SOLA|nr:hypothetical protein RND71_035612 [Anisodus tanguticus]